MSGILFQQRAEVPGTSPNRADVALFVGAVARRPGQIDPVDPRARAVDPLYRWLTATGWTVAAIRRDGAPLDQLLDVPVPIESWAEFDRLFAWDVRPLGDGLTGTTYLGAAVRAFFDEGGRRCYVVRVCDPWPPGAAPADRAVAVPLLIPGSQDGVPTGSAGDRTSWRGIWHLHGLADVSFVSIPDLPDACAPPPGDPGPLPDEPAPPDEGFVECTPSAALDAAPPAFASVFPAPRLDRPGFARWAGALRTALSGLARVDATSMLREVKLLAALPLADGLALPEAERDRLAYLKAEVGLDVVQPVGLSSAFLQLVFPWIRSSGDVDDLPEGLANPEGVMAGLLARNALTRGTFHSAAGLALLTVIGTEPALEMRDTTLRPDVVIATAAGDVVPTSVLDDGEQLANGAAIAPGVSVLPQLVENLVRRVSLLGPTPNGFQLLSDVTTSTDVAYRQAHVGRLLAAVARAARRIGEREAFESSDPTLWSAIRDQLAGMLSGLWRAGALRGDTEQDAYQVRCDTSTMSPSDIDAGRVVVEIVLDPAAAIDSITVALSMQGSGAVALTRAA